MSLCFTDFLFFYIKIKIHLNSEHVGGDKGIHDRDVELLGKVCRTNSHRLMKIHALSKTT